MKRIFVQTVENQLKQSRAESESENWLKEIFTSRPPSHNYVLMLRRKFICFQLLTVQNRVRKEKWVENFLKSFIISPKQQNGKAKNFTRGEKIKWAICVTSSMDLEGGKLFLCCVRLYRSKRVDKISISKAALENFYLDEKFQSQRHMPSNNLRINSKDF